MSTSWKTRAGTTTREMALMTSEMDKQVARVLKDGWNKSLSEARALENAGLLLTPAAKVSLVSSALVDIAQLLRDTPSQAIIPAGVPHSPNDMKRYIADWLEQVGQDSLDNQQGRRTA